MIIIGEKINSSIKAIREAIERRDSSAITQMAQKQHEAGATYIDVNAGMFVNDEPERLAWLVESVQAGCPAAFCIDSPNPEAIEAALKANKNPKPIINSITGEKKRFEAVIPLALEYKTGVIALCMDDSGMPEGADGRFDVAGRLIEKLAEAGVEMGDIFIDPLVRPVSTGPHYGAAAIETIRKVKAHFPEAHIACGLSNVSYGLPARRAVNQAMLVAAMSAGMDGAILDPLDKRLVSLIYATEALLGLDEYCMEFITQFREGNIEA